jgi:hypothetical protein
MKISDKLKTVNNEVSIAKCDNGFIFEVRGETPEENWSHVKIVCNSLDQVFELLTEYSNTKSND